MRNDEHVGAQVEIIFSVIKNLRTSLKFSFECKRIWYGGEYSRIINRFIQLFPLF